MDRRAFLVGGVAGVGALVGCAPAVAPSITLAPAPKPSAVPASALVPGSWEAVRAEFDRVAADRIHMASFFLASHPRMVREAIEAHRKGLDDDPYGYVETNCAKYEIAVRAGAAAYL